MSDKTQAPVEETAAVNSTTSSRFCDLCGELLLPKDTNGCPTACALGGAPDCQFSPKEQ